MPIVVATNQDDATVQRRSVGRPQLGMALSTSSAIWSDARFDRATFTVRMVGSRCSSPSLHATGER
jgi:hypothetical protein